MPPWRFIRHILLCLVILLIPLLFYLSGDLTSSRPDKSVYSSRGAENHPKLNVHLRSTPSSLGVDMNNPSAAIGHAAAAVAAVPDSASKVERHSSSRVHAFYYPWYASPEVEGYYLHWNHRVLPFWGDKQAANKPPVYHQAPEDVGAQFYPSLGAYSSRDKKVIDAHMQQMASAGIGVAVVSWYPPKLADPNGKPSDDVVPLLLDSGRRHGVSVAFHLEPYEPHTVESIASDIRYIIDTYGSHPAFYRMALSDGAKGRPVVYAYDSYKISVEQWSALLAKDGKLSIRGTDYDCVIVGLVVKKPDLQDLHSAGFDGSYTYFASIAFTFGSNPKNWKWLSETSQKLNMLFIPSVGPGYDDTALRPWNADTKEDRAGGKYYSDMISAALELDIEAISITSFNEWGEGTQIEPAVPYTPPDGKRLYLNYEPLSPDGYLSLTKKELKNFVPARF